jgi:hypothetical protein
VVPLFDEAPSDIPGSGELTFDLDTIEALALGVPKTQADAQALTASADIVIRIGSATSTDPCAEGVYVGTFHVTLAGDDISVDQTSLALPPEALAFVVTGRFAVCLEVTANVNALLTIGEMIFIFGPAAPPDDDDSGGGDDDGGGVDGVTFGQVTFSQANDLGPKWDPASDTIAFATDRDPAVPTSTEPVFNIGYVQADGSGEGNMAVGPNSPYGIGGPMFWVGSTGQLLVNERVVFHEYMTFDASQAPFTRTSNDGDDAAFTRKLFIPGGGGGTSSPCHATAVLSSGVSARRLPLRPTP